MLLTVTAVALIVSRLRKSKNARRDIPSAGVVELDSFSADDNRRASNTIWCAQPNAVSSAFVVCTTCAAIFRPTACGQSVHTPSRRVTDGAPSATAPNKMDSSKRPRHLTWTTWTDGTRVVSRYLGHANATERFSATRTLICPNNSAFVGAWASSAPVGHTVAQMPQSMHLSDSTFSDSRQVIAWVGHASAQRVHVERRCRTRVH